MTLIFGRYKLFTQVNHGSQRAVVFSRHTYYSAIFSYWQKKRHLFDNFVINMSFFHYNIANAEICVKLKGTEYGRSEKYSMDKDFEAFIYCDKGIYKSIKILGETASVARCFIQKASEGFLIKKNPTFSQMILQTAKSTL